MSSKSLKRADGLLKGSREFGTGCLSQGVWWEGAPGGLCLIPLPGHSPSVAHRVAEAPLGPARPSTAAEAFPPIPRVPTSGEGHPSSPALPQGLWGLAHPHRNSPQLHIGFPC